WFHPAYLHRTRTATLATVREGEQLTVCFGQDYRGMKARLRELRTILVRVWGGTLILMGLVLAFLVRRSLWPLHRLAAGLERLDAEHLGSFKPVDVPTEARPLLDALVETLRRLETSFRRERSLLSNLAHELRTPLAGLRTTLEVGLTDDEKHARQAMRDSLGITLQMQGVIDSLLLLGRLEAGSLSPRLSSIPLRTLLEGIRDRIGDLDCESVDDLPILADPGWMRIVLGNLFDNARRHAGPDGMIRFDVSMELDRIRISLSNDGCELGPEEVERVFERFWRKDAVRSIESRNSGLGLTLCRELVERMDGTISAIVPEPGVFEVVILLKSGESSDFISASSFPPMAATGVQ
ncbi:MAG: Sensor kinase CusS, partial [Fibrobacterota bacterium]